MDSAASVSGSRTKLNAANAPSVCAISTGDWPCNSALRKPSTAYVSGMARAASAKGVGKLSIGNIVPLKNQRPELSSHTKAEPFWNVI